MQSQLVKRKVVIAAGGTGGHIYPAQALAKQMLKKDSHLEIHFLAGGLSVNPYFHRDTFSFHEVSCGRMHKKSLLNTLKGCWKILLGIYESIRFLYAFKPDLVVGFGSYYALPPLLAAMVMRIPIVLHEANSIPGRVNRLLSQFVMMTGIHFPQAASLLKGRSVEVGMPMREEHVKLRMSREMALEYYQLDSTLKTLLVFGGSQGAQAINRLIPSAVAQQKQPFQVIHITGNASATLELRQLYQKARDQSLC